MTAPLIPHFSSHFQAFDRHLAILSACQILCLKKGVEVSVFLLISAWIQNSRKQLNPGLSYFCHWGTTALSAAQAQTHSCSSAQQLPHPPCFWVVWESGISSHFTVSLEATPPSHSLRPHLSPPGWTAHLTVRLPPSLIPTTVHTGSFS